MALDKPENSSTRKPRRKDTRRDDADDDDDRGRAPAANRAAVDAASFLQTAAVAAATAGASPRADALPASAASTNAANAAASAYIGFAPVASLRSSWITVSPVPVPDGVPHYPGHVAYFLVLWETETAQYMIAPSFQNDPKLIKPFQREMASVPIDPSATLEERVQSWLRDHPAHEVDFVGFSYKRKEEIQSFASQWRKGSLKYNSFWNNNTYFVEALAEFALQTKSGPSASLTPPKFRRSKSSTRLPAEDNSLVARAVRNLSAYASYQCAPQPLPAETCRNPHTLRRPDSIYSVSVSNDGRVDVTVADGNNPTPPGGRFEMEYQPTVQQFARTELRRSVWGYRHSVDSVPALNIVIQIVGSRGDVQPFVALAKELLRYGHRLRLATHATFRKFVTENGIEFYPLAGDPNELMAYMVKNPGLLPGLASIRAGDVRKKREMITAILDSAWKSCVEPDPDDPDATPFEADAIIANPVSFAHVHCAERLMVPCHIIFTMPWSPTAAFPSPLTNMNYSSGGTNYWSYQVVDVLTWEGLGDIINAFRKNTLGLQKLSPIGGPAIVKSLEVPHTYIWSEALIPKPQDWGAHIDVTGFIFLDLASAYTPPQDLADFLAAGPPPVYIGFGSIVVDDPDALTATIFEAVKIANVRAIVSKGWGGLGGAGQDVPDGVYMIGNCPHDWLFKQVSAVVHHGGAGTTSAGLKAGKPTVVVPFFGDQPFWGAMIASIQAGPPPIPFKKLTADRLASAIHFCFAPVVVQTAALAGARITAENGAAAAVRSFHAHLPLDAMRCDVDPHRTARWFLPALGKKVSDDALAALAARGGGGALSVKEPFRFKRWDTDGLVLPGPQQNGVVAAPTQQLVRSTASGKPPAGNRPRLIPHSAAAAADTAASYARIALSATAAVVSPQLIVWQREAGHLTAKIGEALSGGARRRNVPRPPPLLTLPLQQPPPLPARPAVVDGFYNNFPPAAPLIPARSASFETSRSAATAIGSYAPSSTTFSPLPPHLAASAMAPPPQPVTTAVPAAGIGGNGRSGLAARLARAGRYVEANATAKATRRWERAVAPRLPPGRFGLVEVGGGGARAWTLAEAAPWTAKVYVYVPPEVDLGRRMGDEELGEAAAKLVAEWTGGGRVLR